MTRVAASESYAATAFKNESESLTRLGLNDGVDVVGTHQQILLAVDLDLVATELTVDDNIANLDVHGDALTLVVDLAGAHGNDGAALRLLLSVAGDVQTRGGLLLGLVGLDQDAICKRFKDDMLVSSFVGRAVMPRGLTLFVCVRVEWYPRMAGYTTQSQKILFFGT